MITISQALIVTDNDFIRYDAAESGIRLEHNVFLRLSHGSWRMWLFRLLFRKEVKLLAGGELPKREKEKQ